MTCSISSRISHTRGRQPRNRARDQRNRRPTTQPKVQCYGIRNLILSDLPLLTARTAIQNT
jgi:hypothetical protein